jgi:nucleotide-binding universal stress UspA family protein
MVATALEPLDTALPVKVLVALDGSLFAERAIAPASRLAAAIGAQLELWSAVYSSADADERRRHVKALAEPYAAWWDVVVADRTVDAIAEAGDGDLHRLVCLATHGRDRSAGLAHSVSAGVVAASGGPVLLVGPKVLPTAPGGRRLVACVDGTTESEGIVPTAIVWAAALHRDLTILTVAEPVPESLRHPGTYPRMHGPHGDAGGYVNSLAAAWSGPVAVNGQVVYDPVDVDGAIVGALADDPADLVVMGTRRPQGLRRLVFGSTAAAVAHRSPVPTLIVPL